MKSRFTTVAGFLTAATLLSGSAFAFAPEFTGDLQTVIITDRTSNPVDANDFDDPGATGGWAGAQRASSPFLFRYDDAIDLSSIVDPNDALTLANVKVLFTEYTDEADLTPNLQKTIQINGKVAIDDVPTLPADFSGSDAFALSPDAFLDFRNIDFSPGSGFGPFDPVGDVTGHDLFLSGPSVSRVVTLHLGADSFTGRGAASDQSFTVITQIDDIGDRLSNPVPTGPVGPTFTNVYNSAGNFNGWIVGPATGDPGGIATNGTQPAATTPAIGGFAIVPNVAIVAGTAIPASATTIAARTNNNVNNTQQGLLGFQKPAFTVSGVNPLELDADSLYRVRMTISSTNAATNAGYFVQLGNILRTGISMWGFQDHAGRTNGTTLQLPRIGATPSELTGWMYTKASSGGVGVALSTLIVDTNTSDGQEFQIDSVVLEKLDGGRASLGTGTVIKNLGGAVTGIDTVNSPLPVVESPAPTAFAYGAVDGTNFVNIPNGGRLNAAVPVNLQLSSALLTAQHGPAPTSASSDYFQYTNYVLSSNNTSTIDTYSSGIATDPDKVYVADLWASTTTPGVMAPSMALFFTHDLTNFTMQQWHTAGANSNAGAVPALATDPAILLSTSPRVYSSVFQPETPNAMAKTSFFIGFLHANARSGGWPAMGNSTIRIHRVTITEFDPFAP